MESLDHSSKLCVKMVPQHWSAIYISKTLTLTLFQKIRRWDKLAECLRINSNSSKHKKTILLSKRPWWKTLTGSYFKLSKCIWLTYWTTLTVDLLNSFRRSSKERVLLRELKQILNSISSFQHSCSKFADSEHLNSKKPRFKKLLSRLKLHMLKKNRTSY